MLRDIAGIGSAPRYLRQPELRREINEGLNVVENWNSANDFILFGKSSEIASNQRSGQELTMLALHLLQNSLVYINTLMLQQVLTQDSWQNRLINDNYYFPSTTIRIPEFYHEC